MRIDWLSMLFVVLVELTVTGCGTERASPSSTDSIITHPELAPTEDRFESLPEPCPPEITGSAPILPLPWGRRIETYFPAGSPVSELAIDYEVAPLARVDRLRLTYDFDARTQPASTEVRTTCPSTLSRSLWLPPGVSNDVVRVRLDAVDEDGHGRSADLFASVGSRTLQISLEGLDLSMSDPESKWFVLFEPAWGSPRIALFALSDPTATSVSIPSLPEGLGSVALVETAAIVRQEDAVLLHAPEGFAGDFAAYVTGWYQSPVEIDDEVVASLRSLFPAGSSPRYGNLGDELDWVAGTGPLAISTPATSGSGDVRVGCDTQVTVVVAGFARGSVSVDGGEPLSLTPGSAQLPSTTCIDGADSVVWHFEITSLNGRGANLVLREGTP
jgi:hypothetical protein